MEVRQGYKQTEVGIIPVDWEVCDLFEAADFLDGQRRPIKSSERAKFSGIYPYYGASGIIDYVNEYIFDDDLILLGEDGENILSRNLPLAFQVKGKIWVNNHAHVLKPKAIFEIGFLTDYLESLDYSLINSGTAQPKLNKQACLKIKVAKPTKTEQTAIATALSDADALITSLEKLIEKKRAIKQGAMQQLLEPKQGWMIKALGEVADILTGFPFPSNGYSKYGVRLLRGSNIKRGKTDWNEDICEYWPKITSELQKYQLRSGDVVVAMDGSLVGKSFAQLSNIDIPSILLQRVARIRSTIVDINYLKELICSTLFTAYCDSVKTASAIPHISPADIYNFKINYPSEESEQTRIASILSDMDKEIESLEQKLSKYKRLKQGMMQELLTGKIRLV